MRNGRQLRLIASLSFLLGAVAAAHAGGPISEKIVTYPISGSSGVDLYVSIGERGPKVGPTRAIAHTTFDLKWSRKEWKVGPLLQKCVRYCDHPAFDEGGVYQLAGQRLDELLHEEDREGRRHERQQ